MTVKEIIEIESANINSIYLLKEGIFWQKPASPQPSTMSGRTSQPCNQNLP